MALQTNKQGLLVVIAGPTASGKTSMAVKLAKHFHTEVISADSRQFYREIPIGTAAPTLEEMQGVPHHFVGHLSVAGEYNVSKFEEEVLDLLKFKFQQHDVMIMVGGSGLYLDAVCKGIDQLPDPDPKLRVSLIEKFNIEGIEGLRLWLKELDPDYYKVVDTNNRMRLMRGIEVCVQTGLPYSLQRLHTAQIRPFHILKFGINLPREMLIERIQQRTDKMLQAGWIDEAKAVFPYRHLNALNTVGYKELFAYLAGEWSLEQAVEKIKTNTRRYAKRQMTWLRRDTKVHWIDGRNVEEAAISLIQLIEVKHLLLAKD
ncbi:MAG: tRNA (adenosine(37)-N6)-dimethylallyltransferase MiaA [Bacteroidetes bacterium GWF2_41_31]|nr:MAG: tRNA (adenosine(37)-N6)-dimethylallyltransferase MiaA [Bacteroidetes bacterium GWF2_41_31]